jgi:uncharacterized protein YaiI (UPF0178 family)
MKILVDADSCPAKCREIIARRALKCGITAIFAANRPIPLPEKNELLRMELCPAEDGAADSRIISLSEAGDIALTRDVPLAAALVRKNVRVLDDRGRVFDSGNINYHLSVRNTNIALSESDLVVRTKNYGRRDVKAFSDAFDKIILI